MSIRTIEINLPASGDTHPWRRRWLGTSRYWKFQAVGWAGYFACEAFAVVLLAKDEWPWTELATMTLVVVAGLVHSHLLRIMLLRLRRRPYNLWQLGARLLPWCAMQALAMGASVFGIVVLVVPRAIEHSELGNSPGAAELLAVGALFFPLLVCWGGLYFACLSYRHYQFARIERLTLDAAVKEAELRSLKSQVNPHFLFNSLNSLRALIPETLELPRGAITQLAEFLRNSLVFGQHELVPLANELELVDGYLALEQLRHEERLRVVRDIDPAALACAVPPFVIQTLVENAVKFGIGPREEGGTIGIEAFADRSGLLLRITSPGTLTVPADSAGLGLKNARARLRLLFGGNATLTLDQVGPDLVAAEVSIPVRIGIGAGCPDLAP
jgi:hypothetical protein